MSEYLIDRIDSSPKITLRTQTQITALHGDEHLEEVTWAKKDGSGAEKTSIRHVFLMIGAVPNTDWLNGCAEMDRNGFILTGQALQENGYDAPDRLPMPLEASQYGLFAVGDARSGSTKRVASGVGEGSICISQVHQYLAEYEQNQAQGEKLQKKAS